MQQIVILGGGYGGLLSALTARKYLSPKEAEITLVNRDNAHQIVTELHRLAAGNIDEKAIGLPLDKLLKGKSINLMLTSVERIDPDQNRVWVGGGRSLSYDHLVVALGSETAFFGIPGLQENSFTLKSIEDANRIRSHVNGKLAEFARTKRKSDATIVVGGGGLTGVELVGEFADEMPELCRKYGISREDVSLYCVEAGPSILAGFPAVLVERAKTSLEKRGVTFLTGQPITEFKDGTVFIKDGTAIETGTLVWSGGVQGNPVVADCGIEAARGRAMVNDYLQSTSHPNIFLAGDSAVVMGPEGRPYPPSAQLAWQMGEAVGYNLFASIRQAPMQTFQPVFSGVLASLGRRDGVATIGATKTELKGFPASAMKEMSNVRYLSHIGGLFSLTY
ncbi:NAD(P)/FAD-dependent oxidoreductase [Paenibacillus tarimensis]|uniref:NAD(P)/FAD-dependent oxidoreductase n=1 Tax=Paenibacillus tarimensis TaxID=416012 RepID=UPI001F473983|nr:NAD(P)/FAD-dependent oxidoreductase [Paenibacillus tarimensis]MCF2946387.1 NAD(P)/FAD-dependent oxidoreductase [Paenibacillus tarimensis]